MVGIEETSEDGKRSVQEVPSKLSNVQFLGQTAPPHPQRHKLEQALARNFRGWTIVLRLHLSAL